MKGENLMPLQENIMDLGNRRIQKITIRRLGVVHRAAGGFDLRVTYQPHEFEAEDKDPPN
jgi:hypothetical protein